MLPHKKLEDIFKDDPFGLLNVKPAAPPSRTADERLIASFEEINTFYEKNQREPQLGGGIQEMQLCSRLKGLREDPVKMEMLKAHDTFNLLHSEKKEIKSVADIFGDDSFGLLDDDAAGLFDLKHVPSEDERAKADFVAQRKPCPDFDKYEQKFKDVQKDLASGKRKLVTFKQDNLRAGDFYVHNGVLLYLESVEFEEAEQEFKSGSRVRKDGRTRIVFENATESNMLYRSLYKSLLANGKAVSVNADTVTENFIEKFGNIQEEDLEAGYIYILQSKSPKEEIRTIQHLYKIGYSTTPVADRIKNATQEPTYLMAEVKLVSAFKCYNMNTQKFEQLLHNFFGNSCLNLDVFDSKGKRHTPREWFIVPLPVIQHALALIVSGEVVNYRYDADNSVIVVR
ncbi:MAG: GIY-YIG nuclease family protein [Bacteroidota bacterium]